MSTSADPGYFFIIGAMKAGTTSLYKHLAGHPELYASPRKEPRVFRDEDEPGRQRAAFLQLFEGRDAQSWCFEASTAYTKFPQFPGVARRLQAQVPNARFIYLVRNPIERTWSHYVHNLAHGRETRPFAAALAAEPQYLDISRYHLQLSQYYEVFPAERLLVLVFEDMIRDPATTVRSVCAFLGVDTSYEPPAGEVAFNASSAKRAAPAPLRVLRTLGLDEMVPWRVRNWLRQSGESLPEKTLGLAPDVRRHLADTLRPDTEAFLRLIGRRIPAWRDFA